MKDELIQDVVERLVRIETKLDNYEVLREKTEDAKEKADYAFSIAKNNEEDIKEIKENQKWSWRTIAGIGVSVAVYLITKYLGGI
ncbi:hemolysin XhlA family protein [Enterococcus faecalis]|nr:holin [Enterococcus faecalis]NSR85327.1 hemolysin XhlA family protein [Enterococcus faecalis]